MGCCLGDWYPTVARRVKVKESDYAQLIKIFLHRRTWLRGLGAQSSFKDSGSLII